VVHAPLTVDFGDAAVAAAPPGQARVRGVSWRD